MWGSTFIFLGDSFFVEIYDKSQNMMGVAFVTREGQVLWQKDTDVIDSVGMDASHDLLAVGSLKNRHEGTLWAFSRSGDILWTYDNPSRIKEVCVAADSSCVLFIDEEWYIHCIREGNLIWSDYILKKRGFGKRTIAFAPDSSYVVYGTEHPEPSLVASTLNGEKLWSHPIHEYIGTLAISDDSQSIIVTSLAHVYKFTPDGNLVWDTNVGTNNDYIALTPSADFMAVGSNTLVSTFIILDGDGEVIWKKIFLIQYLQ